VAAPDPPGADGRVARPDSAFSDLDRPPLHEAALAHALVGPGRPWRELRVVSSTGSTNADLAAAARAGAAEGAVLVAEAQTAGRGRLGRAWVVPPRAGLTFSVLLRPGPGVPAQRWGWLPLLAGTAVAAALRRVAEVDAVLKWPNDVLVGRRKVAGILAERVPGEALVLGVGVNVSTSPAELPVPEATSLFLAGAATIDRDPLLRAVLRELATRYAGWREVGGDPEAGAEGGLRADYRSRCATIGAEVAVRLPGGTTVHGTALDVDADGRVVVLGPHGATAVAAGDVVHVR
jgi:BirA family transcriptional regulator, biotin operon repressor / biotin---[acetyl-CoA-carboxylase] ligase